MAKRVGLSKRTRFEIFKRDGFKCVYCGATPVDRPLHVDHVEAVAEGGDNDPANLVTACDSCNLGKSAVPLEAKALGTGRVTEADADHAEQIRDYLAVQREVAKAKREVVDSLVDYWCESLGADRYPRELPARLASALREWPLPALMEAIGIVGAKFPGSFGTATLRYFYGILRNWREDAQRREHLAARQAAMNELLRTHVACASCGGPTRPGERCACGETKTIEAMDA
jgi:hypothetical protein